MVEKFGISSDHPLLMYLGLNFCWKVGSISLSSSSFLILYTWYKKFFKSNDLKGFATDMLTNNIHARLLVVEPNK